MVNKVQLALLEATVIVVVVADFVVVFDIVAVFDIIVVALDETIDPSL